MARPKLTPAQRQEILQRAADGESHRSLAREYGVSQPTVSAMVARERERLERQAAMAAEPPPPPRAAETPLEASARCREVAVQIAEAARASGDDRAMGRVYREIGSIDARVTRLAQRAATESDTVRVSLDELRRAPELIRARLAGLRLHCTTCGCEIPIDTSRLVAPAVADERPDVPAQEQAAIQLRETFDLLLSTAARYVESGNLDGASARVRDAAALLPSIARAAAPADDGSLELARADLDAAMATREDAMAIIRSQPLWCATCGRRERLQHATRSTED